MFWCRSAFNEVNDWAHDAWIANTKLKNWDQNSRVELFCLFFHSRLYTCPKKWFHFTIWLESWNLAKILCLLLAEPSTSNNFRVYARRNCLEKFFKMYCIFGIRKSKYFFSFFISSNFGFLTRASPITNSKLLKMKN